MNKLLSLSLFVILLATSCGHKVTSNLFNQQTPLAPSAKVTIIPLDGKVPSDAKKLGHVKLGDSGFSVNCGFEIAIEKAKREARKAGGNIIHITKHKRPTLWSSCHAIEADIYTSATVKEEIDNGEYQEKEIHAYQGIRPIAGKDFPKGRLAIHGGWSSRTGRLPDNITPEYTNYLKDLKTGSHYGADFHFFITPTYGLGGRYSTYASITEINNHTINFDDGSTFVGTMKEDIHLNFYGLSLLGANNLKKNLRITYVVGLGYLGYKNRTTLTNASIEGAVNITGNSLGSELGVGLDYVFPSNFGLGINVSYLGGSMNKATYDNGKEKEVIEFKQGEYESLNRFDISAGVRYYFGAPKE